MARIVKDRIKQPSTTTGTGTITLSGSVAGFQAFSVLGNGSTTFYCIEDANGIAFEVGIGTYTGNTLARTTILESSSSGNAISLTSGTHTAFVTYPAERAGFNDEGLSPTLTASGTITAGKPVIQNTNGTVTQVAETITSSYALGAKQTALSNSASMYLSYHNSSIAYDSTSGAVMSVFRASSTQYPTVIAGQYTSSGQITWGTPSVVKSTGGSMYPSIVSGGGKFHITYSYDGSSNVYARWATASGTTITLGNETALNSNSTWGYPVAIWCSDISRLLVAFGNYNQTQAYANILEVTATAYTASSVIGINTNSNTLDLVAQSLTFDSSTNRVLFTYRSSTQFFAKVLTVTTSSISVGTQQLVTDERAGEIATTYDSNINRIIFRYNAGSGSSPSTTGVNFRVIGITGGSTNTISVTSATFSGNSSAFNNKGSGFVFNPDDNITYATLVSLTAPLTQFPLTSTVSGVTVGTGIVIGSATNSLSCRSSSTFNSTKNAVVTVFTEPSATSYDLFSSSYYKNSVTSSNLTPTNFFGVASNSATTTNPVQINVNGSINNAQTSLVIDKDYYVTSTGLIKERTTTTVTPDTNPTASTITEQNGTAYSYWSNSIAYETTSGYYVRGRRVASSNYPCVESGTWGSLSTGITWNTPTVLSSNSLRNNEVRVATGGGYAHLAYCTRENSNENAKVTPVAISGSGSLSVGTTTTVSTTATSSSEARPYGIEYDTSQNTILAFFYLGWTSGYLNKVFPLQMSGANYSYSSSNAVTLTSGIDVYMKSLNTVFDPDTNRTIAFYHKNNSPLSIHGIVLSCSGASITKGATQSPSLTAPTSNSWSAVAYDTQNNKIIFMYYVSSPVNYAPKYSIVTVTGGATNTLSFTSDAYVFANTSQQAQACSLTWNGDANKLFMVYPEYIGSHIQCNTFTSNGSTLTTISQGEISTKAIPDSAGQEDDASVFVTGKGVSYSLGNADSSPGILNFTLSIGSTTSTVVNGSVFAGTALSATALELKTFPASTIVGKADGAVTKGKPVIVEADGDFAQVASTTTTTSFSQTIGAEITLNTSGRDYYSTAHNNNGTFIIVYRPDSPDKVNARLGTYASNGTITWGTNIVLTKPSVATIQSVSCYYDPDNDCFVALGGTGTNQYVYATILTYSGVTLTEGNYVEFDPNGSNTNGTSHISAQYDTVNNIAYAACSTYGCSVFALTVSGTTITAGPRQYVFGSYTSSLQYLSLDYDSANNRGTMYFRDQQNSYYPSVVAFTSSAGTLTFGAKVVLQSNNYPSQGGVASSPTQTYVAYKFGDYIYYHNLTFSGASITAGSTQTLTTAGSLTVGKSNLFLYNPDGKFYFVFTRSGSPKWLALAQGTVSGTTLNNNNIEIYNNLSSAYEYWILGNTSISNPTMILAGKDTSNNYAEALTFVPTATVTVTTLNLTATNYLGIAQETVSTGNDVKVTTISGVDANQSSLTPAQLYYVQTDGTLSTTAGSPSVVAGTAIAATQLLVSRS